MTGKGVENFLFLTVYAINILNVILTFKKVETETFFQLILSLKRERVSVPDVTGHGKPLPSSEREQQLRLELQQLNHQINQQTQLRGLEVCTHFLHYFLKRSWSNWMRGRTHHKYKFIFVYVEVVFRSLEWWSHYYFCNLKCELKVVVIGQRKVIKVKAFVETWKLKALHGSTWFCTRNDLAQLWVDP